MCFKLNNKSKKTTCRLCSKKKPLLKKSHIIPAFMYKEIFDDKHRILHAKSAKLEFERYTQSGLYESNILCNECDNVTLGRLEDYASRIIYGPSPRTDGININKHKANDGLEYLHVTNIDYVKFKNFLLSILWRASVSKNIFFTEINLGRYEDVIRKIILGNSIPEEDEFRTCIIKVGILPDENIYRFISHPRKLLKDLRFKALKNLNALRKKKKKKHENKRQTGRKRK